MLSPHDNEEVTTSSDSSFPYSERKVSLGSVHSVFSSHLQQSEFTSTSMSVFDVIIDSGCTKHMMPFKNTCITYKQCQNSYIILANKSIVLCHGIGVIRFSLGNKIIILHDALHVSKLRFIADNSGSFLTFPRFFLKVEDSSDCIIVNFHSTSSTSVNFDSRIVGQVSAVSDNTKFRSTC